MSGVVSCQYTPAQCHVPSYQVLLAVSSHQHKVMYLYLQCCQLSVHTSTKSCTFMYSVVCCQYTPAQNHVPLFTVLSAVSTHLHKIMYLQVQCCYLSVHTSTWSCITLYHVVESQHPPAHGHVSQCKVLFRCSKHQHMVMYHNVKCCLDAANTSTWSCITM